MNLLRVIDTTSVAGYGKRPIVLLQVNTSGEASKFGWKPEVILEDAELIAETRHVELAGLMTLAASDSSTARPAFARLREIRDQLRLRTGLQLNELSMGMSGDFEEAIEEGATWVRIGTALFEGVE